MPRFRCLLPGRKASWQVIQCQKSIHNPGSYVARREHMLEVLKLLLEPPFFTRDDPYAKGECIHDASGETFVLSYKVICAQHVEKQLLAFHVLDRFVTC